MSFLASHQSSIRVSAHDLNISPVRKHQSDSQPCQELPTIKLRHTSHFTNEISNCTCNSNIEPSNSVLESSEFAVIRNPYRNGERVSTVFLTSESVISRNRLQECSVHLERLIEHNNTLTHSRKFEDRIEVGELPGLHRPVFGNCPTIAFCNKCGRDVRTRVRRVQNWAFGVSFYEFFCCFPNVIGKQEVVHSCSRCKNELVKIVV